MRNVVLAAMPYMLGFCRQNKDTRPPGEKTVAGAQRRPKWVPYYSAQVLLRLCSGTPLISSMLTPAQVNAAIAHVRRLKRNQPQGKLTLSLDMGTRIKTSQKQEGSAIKHPLRFNLLNGFYSMPLNLLSYPIFPQLFPILGTRINLIARINSICTPSSHIIISITTPSFPSFSHQTGNFSFAKNKTLSTHCLGLTLHHFIWGPPTLNTSLNQPGNFSPLVKILMNHQSEVVVTRGQSSRVFLREGFEKEGCQVGT